MAIEASTLEQWVGRAKPGDFIDYARGREAPQKAAAFILARSLSDDGLVRLHSFREGGGWVWRATRRAAIAKAPPETPQASRRLDPESIESRMFELLRARALQGQVAPTDSELARELGLRAGKEAARYRLALLVAAGLVAVVNRGPRQRRIVQICGTTAQTAEGTL